MIPVSWIMAQWAVSVIQLGETEGFEPGHIHRQSLCVSIQILQHFA